MTFNKKLLAAALVTAGGFAAMSSANAAPAQIPATSFTTSTTVESICTLKSALNNTSFGIITAGQTANNSVVKTTDLILNCSNGEVATISLVPKSTSSTDGTGYMKMGTNETNKITYKLTSDSTSGSAWGSGTAAFATAAASSYATDIISPIYITMTNIADVPAGSYSDTIDVSIVY